MGARRGRAPPGVGGKAVALRWFNLLVGSTKMTTKSELKLLVDELPEDLVEAAGWHLRFLNEKGNPLVQFLEHVPEEEAS